ncbi:hypothetical protein Ntsu_63520 [Nocardia sp. IFM 10818]
MAASTSTAASADSTRGGVIRNARVRGDLGRRDGSGADAIVLSGNP